MTLDVYLAPEDVLLGLPARTRTEVLKALADRCAAERRLDAATVLGALTDRESLGSTGVGAGVAMPHATVVGLDTPFVATVRLLVPIDWQAIDDVPVDLVVMVLSPVEGPASSLNLIAKFARKLRMAELRTRLRRETTAAGFRDALVGAPD